MTKLVITCVFSSLVLVHSSEEITVKRIIVVYVLTMFMCSTAIAADKLKVGFVSVDKILSEAPQIKAVNDAMSKRFGPQKEELQKDEKEIRGLQEEYKRNELVMTDDKLNEFKNKIIAKMQAFKQKETRLSQEVATMRNQELATLQKFVQEIIKGIAKKDKYDLVLSDGVVYAADYLNITDKVLNAMIKADSKKDK